MTFFLIQELEKVQQVIQICYEERNKPVAIVMQQLLATGYVTSSIQELDAAGNNDSHIIGEILQRCIEHRKELENCLRNKW
jgi:hypothetical protein